MFHKSSVSFYSSLLQSSTQFTYDPFLLGYTNLTKFNVKKMVSNILMLQSNLQNLISDGSKTFSRRESQFSLFYPFADYVFIFLRRGRRIIIRLPFIRYPITDSFILTSKSLQCSSSFFSLPRNSTTFSKYFDNRAVASL